jgi:hypothetical protein
MKQIKDYPNYLITTDGRVFSLIKMKFLKTSFTNCGYEQVSIRNEVGVKTFTIHRLVALNYIDNQNNKPQVNHIDGNKKNNLLTNLEWCNASENQIHSFAIGLNKSSEKQRLAVSKTGKLVGRVNGIIGGLKKRKLIYNLENGIFYNGLQEAADSIGVKRSTLNAMLVGQNKNRTYLRYA